MRKPIIAGNWKMNKTPNEAKELIEALKPLVADNNDAVSYTHLDVYKRQIHLKDDVLGLDPGLTGRAADHHPIYHHAGPEAIDFGILGTYGVDDDADSGTADFAVLD